MPYFRRPSHICVICNHTIIEPSDSHDGEEAILCEGRCNNWLHRHCAGLSNIHFDIALTSSDQFMCVFCVLKSQADQILELRSSIKDLTQELANLKGSNQPAQASLPYSQPTVKSKSDSVPDSIQHNRKFNVVVYGISECSPGLPHLDRIKRDLDSISSMFAKVSSINKSAIRDCHRLGKYHNNLSRPRPIIAQMNSTVDVANLLAQRGSLPNNVILKPDLSQQERFTESLLMKERWKLIQSGHDRKVIKIRNSSIFVNGHLHGRVSNNSLQIADLPVAISTALPSQGDSLETSTAGHQASNSN